MLITTDAAGAPRARLSDFGVGALTDRSVLAGSAVTVLGLTAGDPYAGSGTQLYMAPELLEGKVPSVQADLYALGVLLYQIVVGDFSRVLARGWQRDVVDDVLRDDIGCFVDGAPQRRPAGAGEIAERLRGLERRRAERAAQERARRAAAAARRALARGRRRRRLLLAAVTALAVVGAAMTFPVGRTRGEARRAEREAAAARQISGFLESLFQVADPGEARGNSVTAREILDEGSRRIERQLADQPAVQARLMAVMGGVYRSLGLYATARQLTERALETRRGLHGARHPEIAESLDQLGRLLSLSGEYPAAEPLLRDALTMRRELLGEGHAAVAESLCHLGDVLSETTRLEEAERLYRECLGIRRQRFEDPDDRIAEALWSLATAEHDRDPEAAEALYREAQAMYERLHGERHPALSSVLNNLAYLLKDRGDLAGAEPLFRRALEIKGEVLGEDHPSVGIGQSNLAIVLNARGEHRRAEERARRAVEIFGARFGDRHWQTAIARSVLGASLTGQGRYGEAEPLLLESHRLIEEQRGDDLGYAAEALQRLITLYEAWGRPERAAACRARRRAAGDSGA